MTKLCRSPLIKFKTNPATIEDHTLKGVSVITVGPALGHRLWIDQSFLSSVVEAGNQSNGLKSRFTHPGECSDSLGKHLGKATNFRIEGDKVLADISLSESASVSPDGDLRTYIEKLAEESPEDFGLSIVFEEDPKAMESFSKAHHKDDKFQSPDTANSNNYPHARLANLSAVDFVGEPAANKGLFSSGSFLAQKGEAVAKALFLDEEDADIDPLFFDSLERTKTFFGSFLERHNLRVTPLETISQARRDGFKDAQEILKALKNCGMSSEFAIQAFLDGKTLEESKSAWRDDVIQTQQAEIDRLRKLAAQNEGADPVTFAEKPDLTEDTDGKKRLAAAREYQTANGTTLEEALLATAD